MGSGSVRFSELAQDGRGDASNWKTAFYYVPESVDMSLYMEEPRYCGQQSMQLEQVRRRNCRM